jgi:hypothetical protein
MSAPKHEDIQAAVTARKTWEDRQATWYQMRHDGLRRRNKPWPNAADMHFALADDTIEKLKPTFVQQVYATDTVANFAALKSEWQSYQAGAAQWFDYQLKQESNFEEELEIGIDTMLERGKCPVKCFWDPDAQQLRFEAIDPVYLIVPPWTGHLWTADWIVHVQRYSKQAYRALPGGPHGFRKDAPTMAKLCGGEGEGDSSSLETQQKQREGITRSANKDEIVVWEVYFRNPARAWRIKTYSPAAPSIELRPEFGLPYNRGIFSRPVAPPPFANFRFEVKQRGYFTPRGVCERVAAEEMALCKDWNTIKDYQTLTCSPVFYAEQGVPSGQNLRMIPGQILPFKLAAVQFPQIPVDLALQMQGTQRMAQERLGTPSVGTGRAVDPTKNKTAAETNLIATIMSATGDVRSRAFRRQLGELLQLGWGIAIQYRAEELDYYVQDELQQIDRAAFDGKYRIEASGSGDNSNRGLMLQKAVSRKQMFTGNPNINQRELDRSVLEADDPRLVKRLLLDEGTQQAEQIEDQAQEITIMLEGFPAQVRPSDDDASHLQSTVGFVQRRATVGPMLTAEQLRVIAQHAEQHMAALKKKNPAAWAQRGPPLQQWLREVQQQAQALQQQQAAMAGNVVAMPGAMPDPMMAGGMP